MSIELSNILLMLFALAVLTSTALTVMSQIYVTVAAQVLHDDEQMKGMK